MTKTFRVPVILMYHSIRNVVGGSIYRISISPERFERHVEFLTSHYRILPLDEFVDVLASRTRIEGMACITFDDGYVDNLAAARDILRRHRASATIFIPTGFVGRPYFWWDALYTISTVASHQPAKVGKELQGQFPSLPLKSNMGEAEWFQVWDHMRRYPLDDAYLVVGELAARFDADLTHLPRPVTSRELGEFAQWPFEIGSHAVSHRPLSALPTQEMRSELLASRAYLESYTGRPVRTFSYPFGLFDHEVAQHCRDVGYSCAVSLVRDCRVSYSDAFDLPRVDGADGDVDELIAELDKIEQENSRAFAVHSMVAPTPVDTNHRRPSTDSPTNIGALLPPASRGGDLFRATPINRDWGWGRGIPLDRPFIDRFIQTHAGDVHGRVLEVKEPEYASRYARPGAQIDVLDVDPANKSATIIDDLQSCAQIADNTYDCLILTQVLQLIPDFERAIATAARILRPGGVLLLTACGITQGISSGEGDFYWSFFRSGLKRVLSAHFDTKKLLLHSHGNVGLAASFLMGLTTSDVPPDLFSFEDPEYPIVVTARAVKPFVVPRKLTWPREVDQPGISVIVPMFNAETTIKETLFSVSQQNYESYEILIVDDGSTDESRKIVDSIAPNSNGRITVLEHAGGANRGLSLSRNLAIAQARGEFVVFLDADDTIHPGKFDHDVSVLRLYPEIAAVVGRSLWWWDGNGQQDADLDKIIEPLDRVVHPPEFFNAHYQMRTAISPPCIHSWMVRKSAIDRIEPFDPQVMTYEDQKFLGELSLRFPIYVASPCLCDYRRKETSLWATALASGSDAIAYARFLEWMADAAKISPSLKLSNESDELPHADYLPLAEESGGTPRHLPVEDAKEGVASDDEAPRATEAGTSPEGSPSPPNAPPFLYLADAIRRSPYRVEAEPGFFEFRGNDIFLHPPENGLARLKAIDIAPGGTGAVFSCALALDEKSARPVRFRLKLADQGRSVAREAVIQPGETREVRLSLDGFDGLSIELSTEMADGAGDNSCAWATFHEPRIQYLSLKC